MRKTPKLNKDFFCTKQQSLGLDGLTLFAAAESKQTGIQ